MSITNIKTDLISSVRATTCISIKHPVTGMVKFDDHCSNDSGNQYTALRDLELGKHA